MLKKTIKFFRNSAIILAVVSISFSNVPYYSLTKVLDTYIEHQNIVDRSWRVSQNNNVVDKLTSYRHLMEKVRVHEAYAATLEYVGGAEASGNSASYSMSLTGLVGGTGGAVQTGDLVIVATGFVSTSNSNPGVFTAGYTEVADLYANDNRDANLSVNWKFMSGAPDTTVLCRGSGSTFMGAVCVAHVWRNADPTTPLDVVSTTAVGTNGAVPDSPAITPVTSGAMIITAGLGTGSSADNAITAPTGYINKIDRSIDPGSASTVGLASKAWSGIGVEDPNPWSAWSSSNQDSRAAVTLAIRPRNDPPVLTVSQPDGTGDTVRAGDPYDITYSLADFEEVVTTAMYYDTNALGLNGTAISGACATAAEGLGVTCSWNTTGVTPGTYYVYGLTSDGVNPQVSDYSPGMITITPPPTITDYSNTTESTLDYVPACTTCGSRIGGGAGFKQVVTIAGTGLGTVSAGNRSTATNNIMIGTHQIADANVTAWTPTSITFETDSSVAGDTDTDWGAEFGGAGALTVTAGGITSGALNFYVLPQITSVIQPVGFAADQAREYDPTDTDGIITLNGTRFGGTAAGLSGDYYCGMNFDTYNSTYQDTTINFDPADTILGNRACGPDFFSVRWSGYVKADYSQTFTFYTMSDDGVRLSVNGTQIINNWTNHGPIEDSGSVALTAGVWVPIMLEFYENNGGAVVTLSYSSASESKKIIPSTNLETTVVGGAGSVTIVGQSAAIDSWASTAIQAQVSSAITDSVNTGSITMTQGLGTSGLADTYVNVIRILPRITGFTPPSAPEGDAVTINGNHFCQGASCPVAFDANNMVTFTSAKDATVLTTWSASSITTQVPMGAVTGDVLVISNTQSSNLSPFSVTSLVPGATTNLNQWKDAALSQSIAIGGVANAVPIYLTMTVENTVATGGTMYPQVEYKPIYTAFVCTTSTPCASAVEGGAAGAAPGPIDCSVVGNGCSIAISPSVDDIYHWQARMRYHYGATDYFGPWTSFDGANPETSTDFQIDTAPPVITFPGGDTCAGAVSNLGTNSAQIDWTVSETSTGQIEYSTDPNLAGSTLLPVPASPSAFSHSVILSNLNSGATYYFKVKSLDTATNIGTRPTVSPYCSFTTSSNLSPAKTIKSYINGAIGAISSAVTYYFTVNVPEVTPLMQNAYLEVFGVASGGSGTIAVQANGAPSQSYSVSAVAPTLYKLMYKIPSPGSEANLNLNDVAPCTNGALAGLPLVSTPPCNSLSVTPTGVNIYVLSTKIITTYTYTP